jgi:Family of unknown function (DUF6049)
VRPRGRPGPTRLLASLGAAAVVGTALFAATPAAARTTPTPTPTPTSANAPNRVIITLNTLEPKVLRPHDTLQLDGTMVNISGVRLTGVSVALRGSSHRLDTRYDLAREADPSQVLGSTLLNTRQSVGALDPGQSMSWQFSLSEQRLDLPDSADEFGAYPLAIDVRSTLDGSTQTTRLPTTVMWVPDGAQYLPTQISWLVPLVDGIHRGAGDTFFDDQLASDLATQGRLGKVLDLTSRAPVPVTYAVDPALVDDATLMAGPTSRIGVGAAAGALSSQKPVPSTKATAPPKASASASAPPTLYLVESGGRTATGTGSAAAAAWLASLRSAVDRPRSALIGLPYADTDLVAVERAGLNKEIGFARSTGQSALTADLGAPSLPSVVWPVGGVLDEPTLDDLAGDLVDTVVLTDQALPPRDPNAVTGARTNLQTASGTVRAVLTDTVLANLLTGSSAVNGGTRAVEQRFLAETMLITEQRPGLGSSVVIAAPRDWDPSDGFAATLLDDSAAVPWLRGANLGQVIAQPADGVPRNSLVYPDSARGAELRPETLGPISGLRDALAACSAILGSSTTETFINTSSIAILRAESSGLRNKPARSALIRSAVQAVLDTQTSRVYIVKPGLITLTSRKQKIPITVVNNLPDPVTVQIRLAAVNAARLTVAPQAAFTVPGNQGRHEVLVEVEATTGGRFDVSAQLWTPDANPRPYGAAVPFVLNSTAYGAVALAIFAGAAALVFLLSAVRVFRRVRLARRRHREAGGATAQSAPGDAAPGDSAGADNSVTTTP